MKSDISRPTINLPRNNSRLIFQQGRPPLEADFNEQSEILLQLIRTYAKDIIGEHGAAGAEAFKITPVRGTAGTGPVTDLNIGAGHYYVDGLLCENASKTATLKTPPFPASAEDLPLEDTIATPVLVYLDVWEHHRTWIDDGVLRDPALGGSDTATRSRIVWQVRRLKDDKMTAAEKAIPAAKANSLDWKHALETRAKNRGQLGVRLNAGGGGSGDCEVHAEARYRGVENQLYRVEIHRPGPALPANANPKALKFPDLLAASATFKWSRENGSVAAKWLPPDNCDLPGGGVLRIEGPRDRAHGFSVGDWVEVTDETRELSAQPGVFARLARVEGNALTLEPGGGALPDWKTCKNPKVRRWDQQETGSELFDTGTIVLREKQDVKGVGEPVWFALENGIEIQFSGDADTTYRTGDYWLIPVRVATGDLLWPWKDPSPDGAAPLAVQPPHGIEHHYAPLAIIGAAGDTDLRPVFEPIAK